MIASGLRWALYAGIGIAGLVACALFVIVFFGPNGVFHPSRQGPIHVNLVHVR
ncbi:MAG TPA: hypothetical protein VK755_01480 [Candidatus Acidoferrales bacterium]|jgi:hypothetical protein|nr:hypothetical protein [Candidatus Acidoferrales bacterium]